MIEFNIYMLAIIAAYQMGRDRAIYQTGKLIDGVRKDLKENRKRTHSV